jgi:2-oxoglutarate ferredoxin oxidoreductase subunit beta
MVEYVKPLTPSWCPGCGDFSVLAALKKSLAELKIPVEKTALIGGIGCAGGYHNFTDGYGYHSMHGRLLPTAIGVKLANPNLTVVAAGGDGDGYAIGMGHFVHTLKKNASIVYVVMNNETYGLTTGQASPTSPVGFEGNLEMPFNAVLTALSVPSTSFVARGFSGLPKELTALMTEAIKFAQDRKGFAFLEVLSPCVTYNNNYDEWRGTVEDVSKLPGYDPTSRPKSFALCLEVMERGKIPIGKIFSPAPDKLKPSLDVQVVPDPKESPTNQDISIEHNLARYQKLLASLG